MEVVILQAFVSLMLVAGLLLLFGYSIKQRDYEHADRLALLPMQDDTGERVAAGADLAKRPDGTRSKGAPTTTTVAAGAPRSLL